jgi:hypothetical protein
MKRLAVATLQAEPISKPLTSHRLRTIPKRIHGLHRLSIVSKTPFEVDIGGRAFKDARTLDVFHEAPMFIDEVANMAAVDAMKDGRTVRMIRLHPTGGEHPLEFRITAHEEMAERHEFKRSKVLASVDTPLEYKGVVKHVVETVRDDEYEIGMETEPNQAADVIAQIVVGALALSVSAGAAAAMLAIAAAPTYAPAIMVCDPSRTYINGALFKNLKEVRVKIRKGTIVGYTYP